MQQDISTPKKPEILILELLIDAAARLETAFHTKSGTFKITRRKIEKVIFDDRIEKISCVGGCVECHLDDLT